MNHKTCKIAETIQVWWKSGFGKSKQKEWQQNPSECSTADMRNLIIIISNHISSLKLEALKACSQDMCEAIKSATQSIKDIFTQFGINYT